MRPRAVEGPNLPRPARPFQGSSPSCVFAGGFGRSGLARPARIIVETHKDFARSTAGLPLVPSTWTVARHLITPHPLGGCNMGRTPHEGVVNHAGEIFGYRNLYVADGAIVPEALGLNPSKTIAALAERIAAIIREERR
jgi:choline dehydrogenase-like flavoprotein